MQTIDKPLDVKQFIDEQPLTRYQWRIAVLCFLIVFLDGLDTSAMGFIAPALTQDWGIDRSSLGPVMSAALMGMVVGALASGALADRFGRKSVLLGSVLIFGVLSVATSISFCSCAWVPVWGWARQCPMRLRFSPNTPLNDSSHYW